MGRNNIKLGIIAFIIITNIITVVALIGNVKSNIKEIEQINQNEELSSDSMYIEEYDVVVSEKKSDNTLNIVLIIFSIILIVLAVLLLIRSRNIS